MKFLIINADTPSGFYLINLLLNKNHKVHGILIGDGEGDNFIHNNIDYYHSSDRSLYVYRTENFDGIFYLADTHRIYTSFVDDIYAILNFNIPIIAILDWEMFNGVKRGNFPVSAATPPFPDTLNGVSKAWIKDTLLLASKFNDAPISVMATPTVLSPFHITKSIRVGAENYLAQKLYEIIESYKTGSSVEVNKGDLRVIYDIIHNADVVKSAWDIFNKELSGYFLLSSNEYFRLQELLEIFYGRLIDSERILIEDTDIIIKNRRRSIENYDTSIDMVYLWTETIYSTNYTIEKIFDDIIHTYLSVEYDYQIALKLTQ